MNRQKIILSENEKKKIINAATFEPRPAKSHFIANGRFSHSGSHMFSDGLTIVIQVECRLATLTIHPATEFQQDFILSCTFIDESLAKDRVYESFSYLARQCT